jgi:hypothetical protein
VFYHESPNSSRKVEIKVGIHAEKEFSSFQRFFYANSSEITLVAHFSIAARRTKSKRGENDKVCKRIVVEFHVFLLHDTSFLG